MFELSVTGEFAASHMLRGYAGKCSQLHGHTWKVEVVIASEQLNDIGLVVDFAVVKKQLREFLEELDHVHLNDLPIFQKGNPTTENIAQYIFEQFSQICQPVSLKSVRVWESERASVTYYP